MRNSLDKKKLKKKKKKKVDAENIPKKISGFDFRGWDKFDVVSDCKRTMCKSLVLDF